jgi:hypothetical protein
VKGFRARILFRSLIIGSLLAMQTGIVAAQIPIPTTGGGTPINTVVNDTTDTLNDPVNNTVTDTTNTVTETTNTVNNTVTETTNTVNNTVTETTNTVNNTVTETTNTVNNTVTDTTNTVNNTVNETTNTVTDTVDNTNEVVAAPKPKLPAPKTSPVTSPVGTVGTVVGTVGTVVTGGTQDAISATGGATGPLSPDSGVVIAPSAGPADAISAIAATTGASGTAGLLGLSGGLSASSATGRGGLTYSSALGTVSSVGLAKRFQGSRFLLNWTSILGVSQPTLAILVDAVNDADGDGIYSDAEIAPAPSANVSFKALITNIGSVNFEIATVTHSYNGGTGPAQGEVCGELVGIMLAPGESLACAFPIQGYSPAQGQSLVNTVTAAGFEVGKGARRGASDSDTSAVDTLLANAEVLGVAIKRNLAFTGTDAARLVALALLLLAAGGAFLSLARIRTRRPAMPLPSESPGDMLGWWAAGPDRSRSRWKVGRR